VTAAVALAPPFPPERGRGQPARSRLHGVGGEPTLDEVLVGVWEGLAAHRSAPCLVCGEEMRLERGAQALQPSDSGAALAGAAPAGAAPRRAAPAGEAGRRADRVPVGGRCLGCQSRLT
jgi:hypothetical protein